MSEKYLGSEDHNGNRNIFAVDFGGIAWPESGQDAERDAPGACAALANSLLGRGDQVRIEVENTTPVIGLVARIGFLQVAVDGAIKVDAQRTGEGIHQFVLAAVQKATEQHEERTVPDLEYDNDQQPPAQQPA